VTGSGTWGLELLKFVMRSGLEVSDFSKIMVGLSGLATSSLIFCVSLFFTSCCRRRAEGERRGEGFFFFLVLS
jgi:hypothetical protein